MIERLEPNGGQRDGGLGFDGETWLSDLAL